MDIENLYREALKGDASAEKALFERLFVRFNLICHHRVWNDQDAQEVAQEALMTVLGGFREIEIERSFAAWAHKVLNNKILSYLKNKKAGSRRRGEADFDTFPDNAHDGDAGVRAALLQCLRDVGKANSRYARVLNLHYQGYSTAEICRKLKLNRGHLYVLLMRARAMLAECLRSRVEL